MQAGQGNITINGRDMKTYFGNELLENIVNQPLAIVEQVGQYDIKVNVGGGGISAQAEAIRLASQIANILRGKHKPSFTPNSDCGDSVIVVNADKLRVTGKKLTDKIYVTHSGYPGGQKRVNLRDKKAKNSASVIEHAVKGMLQGNRLGREQFRNLFVYAGTEHPHEAQQPKAVDLKNL